jgi:GNAT superfamily N-acetyltransferase
MAASRARSSCTVGKSRNIATGASRALEPTTLALTVDTATEADIPTLLVLIGELAEFERLAHEVVVTEASLREALFAERPVVETVIARVDGEVAGFALYFHNFSTFLGRRGLFLEDLYVRPAFRGQGIGRDLLVHVARLAAQRDCGRMEWSVLNWNRRAVGFYEALGARPVNDWTVYRLDRAALDALQTPPPRD